MLIDMQILRDYPLVIINAIFGLIILIGNEIDEHSIDYLSGQRHLYETNQLCIEIRRQIDVDLLLLDRHQYLPNSS